MKVGLSPKDRLVSVLKDSNGSFSSVLVSDFSEDAEVFSLLPVLRECSILAGMGFYAQIGGCEAMRDLYDAVTLGVDGIIVPMVESAYSFEKFTEAADDLFRDTPVRRILSVDSMKTISILEDLLSFQSIDLFLFDRADIAASSGMYLDCDGADLMAIISSAAARCHDSGRKTAVSGGISSHSVQPLFDLSGCWSSVLSGIVLSDYSSGDKAILRKNIENGIRAEYEWLRLCTSYSGPADRHLRQRIRHIDLKYGAIIDRGES